MRVSKYILTADDYGACDFIDRGIIKAIKAGKINSVACFAVPFDKGEEARKKLKDRILELTKLQSEHDFAIGLHFSLSAGRPSDENTCKQGNSLTVYDHIDECFYFRSANDYPFRHIVLSELEDELRSQINALQSMLKELKAKNVQIDSISNHHGLVYMNTSLFRSYANVAAEFGIPIRSPLIWRKANLPYRNWDKWPFNPMIRQGRRLHLLDQVRNAMDYESRLQIANELNLLYTTCLVDEIYGQAHPTYLNALFDAYNLGHFSAEFMFHLGDEEYRREVAGLDDGNVYKLEEPWGIDAGYYAWREEELRVLLECNLPEGSIVKTIFRKLIEIDKALPSWNR